jgi:hypothetical protein
MENNIEEIWRDIPEYENMYQVSNLGNVKSLSRTIKHWRGGNKTTKERMLKPTENDRGYKCIILCKKGTIKGFLVHQVVAMAFLNHIPCGHKLVVDHINDNPLDNRLENLQVVTQRENAYKTQGKYSSQYKGVSWNIGIKKWVANIWNGNKLINLGSFENEYDAHLKYQETLKTLKL